MTTIYERDLPHIIDLVAEAKAANELGHALEAQAEAARAAGDLAHADELHEQANAAYAQDASCCRRLYEYTVPAIEYSQLGGIADLHARRAIVHANCAATLAEARRQVETRQ